MTSTAKRILAASVALGLGTAALAEPRYNPTRMTCEDVRDVIRQHGAVTLRYMSQRVRNLPLYNRYVRNTGYCERDQVAVAATVPTRDNPRCRVSVCERRDYEDNDDFLLPGWR